MVMNRPGIISLALILYSTTALDAAGLPDPTRPPDYSATTVMLEPREKKQAEFNLTAIRINDDNRSVIINGKLLRQGEQVGSARLLEIHSAHVVLLYQNKRLVVRLYDSLTRKVNKSAEIMKITN